MEDVRMEIACFVNNDTTMSVASHINGTTGECNSVMELYSSVFLHRHLHFCSINLCVMKFVKWEISEHYLIILTLFWHWLTGSSKWTNAWNWTSLNANNDMDFGLNWVWNFFIFVIPRIPWRRISLAWQSRQLTLVLHLCLGWETAEGVQLQD